MNRPGSRREDERRRLLARALDDVPGEASAEDSPEPRADARDRDEWLRREVPPHHG